MFVQVKNETKKRKSFDLMFEFEGTERQQLVWIARINFPNNVRRRFSIWRKRVWKLQEMYTRGRTAV